MRRFGFFSVWAYDTETRHYGFVFGPAEFPKWHPSAPIIAFKLGLADVYVYNLETDSVRQLSFGQRLPFFDWTPDGGRLMVAPGWAGHWGCNLIDTLGTWLKMLNPPGWGGSGTPNWSSVTNRVLFSAWHESYPDYALILADTTQNLLEIVLTPEDSWVGIDSYCDWAPDQSGFLLTVTYVDDVGQTFTDLRHYRMDGSLVRVLTRGGVGRWSPDGTKIVFQKYTWMAPSPNPDLEPDYGRTTVWICNADGSDMHELLGWPQTGYDSTLFGGGYNWVTRIHAP